MATKANTKDVSDNTEEANDAPLAGSGNLADAIKKLLKKGKDAGFVTLDELNAILPPERISSELIEDVMAQLNDMGINVVEGEESEEDAGDGKASAEEDYGRTDDPVRLYLREMGAVELLSREGEIAIAKRIEAGREMMISGICESPLTIQAIVDWNEALKEGRLLLRDIIDLEAMQDSPETASESPGAAAADEDRGDAATDAAVRSEGSSAKAGKAESEGGSTSTDESSDDGAGEDSGFEDEDNISLAAIEEKLKPQVIEIFDKIAATYGKLGKLQHQRLVAIEKGEEPARSSDAKIVGYKEQLVDLVRTIRFNNARLEQLVQQLYTLNRRLMGLEGRLLRLGLDAQLTRDEFLERYYGHELDPNWFAHVLLPPPPPKPVEKVQKIAENVGDRLLARAQREREAAAKEKEKADAIAAKAAEKQRVRDEAAAVKAAEKQRVRDEAAAKKQAETDAKARDKAKADEAKAKEKARLEADRAKAKATAEKERAKAAQQRDREKAAAQKERERAAALREREKAAAQREKDKAAAQRDKDRAAALKERERAAAAKAKPAVKKAPAKAALAKKAAKPVAKKAAPKSQPKKQPAKKAAAPTKKGPAKKMATKSASKSSARPAGKSAIRKKR